MKTKDLMSSWEPGNGGWCCRSDMLMFYMAIGDCCIDLSNMLIAIVFCIHIPYLGDCCRV